MTLRHRIERLEREFLPRNRNTLYLAEIEFVYRMVQKYGKNFESAPSFLRAEYEYLSEIWKRAVKPPPGT